MNLWTTLVFGNPLFQWLVALAVGLVFYALLRLLAWLLRKNSEKHKPQVTFNRAHFKSYSDSALVFEVAYSINEPGFDLYMDTQQQINLEIYRRFSDEGIDFAYPTRTVLLGK